jgi:hypothetical protein
VGLWERQKGSVFTRECDKERTGWGKGKVNRDNRVVLEKHVRQECVGSSLGNTISEPEGEKRIDLPSKR